jgi:hypothetical protein
MHVRIRNGVLGQFPYSSFHPAQRRQQMTTCPAKVARTTTYQPRRRMRGYTTKEKAKITAGAVAAGHHRLACHAGQPISIYAVKEAANLGGLWRGISIFRGAYIGRMTDDWNEKLRCPNWRKTGIVSLHQGKSGDTPTVQSVPDGFKVVNTLYGPISIAEPATSQWNHKNLM